jgi:hypothetical protein
MNHTRRIFAALYLCVSAIASVFSYQAHRAGKSGTFVLCLCQRKTRVIKTPTHSSLLIINA